MVRRLKALDFVKMFTNEINLDDLTRELNGILYCIMI